MSKQLPDIPAPFSMPFYYSALKNVAVYYAVPPSQADPFLQKTALQAPVIEDRVIASYNFQSYFAYFASGLDLPSEKWLSTAGALTQELELNIVAAPKERIAEASEVTIKQLILGDEQSKVLGNHRIYVPCDAPLAIEAGKKIFGEPKFLTSFKVNLASRNPVRGPGSVFEPNWLQTYGFRVDDPSDATESIFTAEIDVTGLNPIPGNYSPITEYGSHNGQLIGCRWNILQPMDTYFLGTDAASHVSLTFGASSHPMNADMQRLIGDCAPIAVRIFESQPAAIQSRAYTP